MIGSSLSQYRIAAKLGAGGMGEVYRATDTRLEREVAIKVLPADVAQDAERLARFEREAKLLASLNHSNIAHVYGFESATREDGSSAHFLVMELVEGEDLAERLSRGAIPVDDALEIAKQIAEALEEAHEKGIVHRDLKPANVKLTTDGKVKVLDFGLAKAFASDAASVSGSGSDLSQSPTLAHTGTQAGLLLGTAAYMSPEQARGKPVDKRADIWAFGVVLWEVLTGRRLFEGETVSDVLAGVLKTDIDLAALPAETPPTIHRLLRSCLERNPRNRLHDIADARLMIDEAFITGGADGPRPVGPVARQVARGRLAGLGVLLLALGVLAGWLARGAPTAPAAAPEFALRRLTDLPGLESQPDLSPDGKQVAYTSAASGNKDIYVMRADGGRAIDITASSPDDDEQAAFSPDGQRLAFRSSRDGGGLFVMGATGESVRRITDEGFDPAWSPDGEQIAYSMEPVFDPYARQTDAPLWIVDLRSGEKRRLPAVDAVQPAWSPDGRRIAYWANTDGQRDVWTVAVTGGEPVAVTQDLPTDWSPTWSPDGRWLYFSSDRAGGMNLFRVRIDPATGGASGAPEPVTTSVGSLGWARWSSDGRRMVAAAYALTVSLDLYRLTPGADPELQPLRTLRPRSLHWCRLSPDAVWLACSTVGTPEDLVLLRADGSELRRLTDDAHKDRNISWAPDGERLTFDSTRGGSWSYWSLRTDGSGLRQLNDFDITGSGIAWRADGKHLTVAVKEGLVELDVEQLTRRTAIPATPLPSSLRGFSCGAWSPSGTLLGGVEEDEGLRAVSVGAIDMSRGAYRRSRLPMSGFSFWRFAGWLPDSRHFVASGDDEIALVDVETGAWRGLGPNPGGAETYVTLSSDGQTLLVETPTGDGDIWMLERVEAQK